MHQKIFLSIIIFFAIILQVSFFPNLIPIRVFPDIALMVIIFWAVRLGFDETLKWAVLAGFVLDLVYFWPVGTTMLSFVFIAYGANSLAKRFLVSQTIFRFFILAGLVVFGTITNSFIINLVADFIRGNISGFWLAIFNVDILLKTLYNISIFSLIYVPLKKADKFFSYLNPRLSP